MATLRITVTAENADLAGEFKEKFYKALYEHSGSKVTFEVPEADTERAEEIKAAAVEAGHEAEISTYEDPLDSADASVDFW
jgi:hypothetical protein